MPFVLCRSLVASLLLVAVLGSVSLAQPSKSKQEIFNENLTTRDGVSLAITYYKSDQGKSAVPVVILHDAKETRQNYSQLAKRLSKPDSAKGDKHKSFAVVTVDLRGHGESVKQTIEGRTRELSASKLRAADYAAMVLRDMEAVRKFLVDKNDLGELNLNSLSVIGVGMGASVGINWTAADWAVQPLATGKQGQDVKSLIMVSPRWKSNGLSSQNALKQPGLRRKVAVLMMYGEKDRRVKSDVLRIHKQLQRDRKEPDDRDKYPDLMKVGVDTELQGSKWLKKAGDNGVQLMVDYLNKHSVEPENDWIRRRD